MTKNLPQYFREFWKFLNFCFADLESQLRYFPDLVLSNYYVFFLKIPLKSIGQVSIALALRTISKELI